ncbi:hypothetical protein, partial [Streptomyces sp. A012304]|uniref:hypothetical protein n=1 Tax=Streptomyces sp. A012304 TaxID=375446 RepID=UPI0022319A4A
AASVAAGSVAGSASASVSGSRVVPEDGDDVYDVAEAEGEWRGGDTARVVWWGVLREVRVAEGGGASAG